MVNTCSGKSTHIYKLKQEVEVVVDPGFGKKDSRNPVVEIVVDSELKTKFSRNHRCRRGGKLREDHATVIQSF
jgi:hypothetical protein